MLRVVILILCSVFLCPMARASKQLSKDECLAIVNDLQRMSNLNPGEVESRAPDALDKLRNGESPTYYFIAFNIYAENLFNKGMVDKARLEIEQMLNEAFSQPNVESKVVALRTQGQFYYKLGLYERAADCFNAAMELCPAYDSPLLDSYFTWSSTLFWLVQADIRAGRIAEAEQWLKKMDAMMQWLDSIGNTDKIGYKPVMILGLKAKIALQRGYLVEADTLVNQCPNYIIPDVPARAYVEYYVAKMLLYVQRGSHDKALPILDELIEMHIDDYKPIAAEFIRQKGLSLAALGRFEESAKTLTEYIEIKNQVNELAVAQQLDELSTRYEVEKIQHERDNIRKLYLIVLFVCSALAVIIALIVISQKKLRRKNKILARNISELNRLAREAASTETNAIDAEAQMTENELIDIGNKVVDYINQSRCYLQPECSRDTIKEGVGVAERTLAKAIVAATGLSFVNYINHLRLKSSIDMLEGNPEMTINDISTACGFGSVRQFQRIFKQHFDMSPSAYREANSHGLE